MSSMLTDDFFSLRSLQVDEPGKAQAMLFFNAEHPILKAHFPGRPVVPGACLLQMTKELLVSILQKELVLKKANHLKFISPIDPVRNPEIHLQLQYLPKDHDSYLVTATYSYDNTVCCKISAEAKIV